MRAGLAALAGVRVLDFSQALSGPYCTMMLADLGAEVIKVERPGRGDDARHWGPPFCGDDAAYFVSVNRNKQSVVLDLKSGEGQTLAAELASRSDVVVENFRPGVASSIGLDPEKLRRANARLIYCSISGFGQGSDSRSGYDQIVQGESGVMSISGPPGQPTKWGVPIGDIGAGMYAACAILAALNERNRTQRGVTIDIAMQDCLLSMLTYQSAAYLRTMTEPQSSFNSHPTIAPYGLFRTLDGSVNICVGNDSQFQRMCVALECEELSSDPEFDTNARRVGNAERLTQSMGELLSLLTVNDVLARLEAAGVPAGRVRTIGDAVGDPSTVERQLLMEYERQDSGAVRVINTPWKFDGRAAALYLPPPQLGEHNVIIDALLHDAEPTSERSAS
jgi:formyl-CoA transferase